MVYWDAYCWDISCFNFEINCFESARYNKIIYTKDLDCNIYLKLYLLNSVTVVSYYLFKISVEQN